ncbi:MAG: DUF4255 domain-containing protein, partial [Oscillatoria sp. Prado101]|nr:DUF4255 domain-containing protein [Oscillatoria sp. Prado101]
PPLRGSQRTPLQAAARYLVTTWAGTPEDAHRLLGDLLFAAMDSAAFQAELNPLPAAAWTAFGLPPQPSFVLRVPLQIARPQPPVVNLSQAEQQALEQLQSLFFLFGSVIVFPQI